MLEKRSNMFAVSSHCTFSLGLSVFFHLQVAELFLEWVEQLKEGLPDDELGMLAAGTRILDAFATEQELYSSSSFPKNSVSKSCISLSTSSSKSLSLY